MDILYQDEALCVCIKPVGLDSQIGVPEALKAQLGGEFYPVHRLDENVGGSWSTPAHPRLPPCFPGRFKQGPL